MRKATERSTADRRKWAVLGLALLAAAAGYGQNAPAATSVPRAKRQVVVSIPDRKLAVLENGTVLRTFDVAVGSAASPSPAGEFEIVNRIENPTYYHPGTVIPPGKSNPIGTRWIGLNKKGYGIHGTNVPRSIGKAASHGCVRLRNHDIEELFSLLNVGDTVQIHSDRNQQVTQLFGGPADADNDTVAENDDTTTSASGGGQ